MTFDIVLAGVGGQGVLSLGNLIAAAAVHERLNVKQSEVHGMSQRGGAVTAHVRLASTPIESELIPLGTASMILSLEPIEALRYLEYLSPAGVVVTSIDPFNNIPNYPAIDDIKSGLSTLPRAVLVEATSLARRAGLARATNMVMAGAAAPLLPIGQAAIENCIRTVFAAKGPAIVAQNLAAFYAGQEVSCTWTR